MTQLHSIVRRPVRALLALVAFAGLLAVAIVPASAGVVTKPGMPNSIVTKLDKAGKPGDNMHFARWFKAPNASLTVSVDFALAIQEDTQIRVKVINLSSGNTIFNKTTKLTFANKSHTFSWNVSENIPTPFRITVTNLSNSKIPPTLFMVVK